jgi:hypothetical protein
LAGYIAVQQEPALIEDPKTAKYVMELFFNINDQMDRSIVTVAKETSAEECKAYKRGVGYVMCEVFEKIIEPLCKRHPSLKPPGLGL